MNKLIIIDDKNCKKELDSFLDSNTNHVKLLLSEDEYSINLDTLIEKLQLVFNDQQILFFKTLQDVIKVTLKEIKSITEEKKQTRLFLTDDSVHLLPDSIAYYITKLENHNMIQVNQSTLINSGLIEKLLINEQKVFLSGGEVFYAESQYMQHIVNTLNKIDN